MIRKQMYRVRRDGRVHITPHRPSEAGYTILYRLIADEGMILTDGERTAPAVDTNNPDEWSEIEDTAKVEIEPEEAFSILTGGAYDT